LTQLALYSGQGNGSLTLDGSGDVPAMAANFRFSGLQMEPLLVALAGTDRLTGRGAFAISVNARAHSREEMIRALAGNGSFDLANGAIRGVNLIGAAEAALSALSHGATSGNETAFGSLTGTFTVGNGILHNGDLRLTSGPVPVQGAGTVNLVQETVDYRVTVQIAGQAVPILVSGPINNLSYRPDVASALENMVKNPAGALQKVAPTAPKSVPGGAAGSLLNNLLRR
jgi:AsmA protein